MGLICVRAADPWVQLVNTHMPDPLDFGLGRVGVAVAHGWSIYGPTPPAPSPMNARVRRGWEAENQRSV